MLNPLCWLNRHVPKHPVTAATRMPCEITRWIVKECNRCALAAAQFRRVFAAALLSPLDRNPRSNPLVGPRSSPDSGLPAGAGAGRAMCGLRDALTNAAALATTRRRWTH